MLSIRQKATRGLSILKKVKPVIKMGSLIDIYKSINEPYFTYCCIVWDSIGDTQIDKLRKLKKTGQRA